MIENYKNWKRVGKGKVFQFLAMDEDVLNWLNNLPPEYLPYRVLIYYPVKLEKIYEWKFK